MTPALSVVPEVSERLIDAQGAEIERLTALVESLEQEKVRHLEALESIEARAAGMQSDCDDGASMEALGFSYIRALASKARKGR
jgi:hypothetical protein